VDVVWIKFSSLVFFYNTKVILLYATPFVVCYLPYLFYRNFRPDPKIMTLLLSTFFVMTFSAAAEVLSYLAYTTNQPMINELLAVLDKALGISAPAIVSWFREPAWLNISFYIIYSSLLYQVPFLLIYFSYKKDSLFLERIILQYMLAAFLAIFIGALGPSIGTHAWYGFMPNNWQPNEVKHLYDLRDHILDLGNVDGIITFPSFHAAMGVIFTYAFRYEKAYIFLPIFFLNLLMCLSCVSHGDHFFVDVPGGIAVAFIAILIESLIYRWIKKCGTLKESSEEFKKTLDSERAS
jgi:membrane-associated phospholipid phosphatase